MVFIYTCLIIFVLSFLVSVFFLHSTGIHNLGYHTFKSLFADLKAAFFHYKCKCTYIRT